MKKEELKAIKQRYKETSDMTNGNAEFIAAARTDIPALVAEVERLLKENLDAEIDRLRARVEELTDRMWPGHKTDGYEYEIPLDKAKKARKQKLSTNP